MGVPNLTLLRFFAEEVGVKTFVETGTCFGKTVKAVSSIFSDIYTVELSTALYAFALEDIGKQVHCYQGKSVGFLRRILPEIGPKPVVYWLDAHFSGGRIIENMEQCPLLEELEVINSRSGNDDFIVIDDAHLFFSPAAFNYEDTRRCGFDARQWPSLTDIFARLNEKPRYTFVLASQVTSRALMMSDDSIVSVPAGWRERLFSVLCSLELA